jgi:hypothetical protein
MVKSLKGTISAEFLAQLRTMTVSEKARKQAEARALVDQRVVTVQQDDSYVISPSFGKFVEKGSDSHVVTKLARFNENFFHDVLVHLASQPTEMYIPSRRQILSEILHTKMQRGDYIPISVKNNVVHGLSWNDFESLVSAIVQMKVHLDSSSHDVQRSLDVLSRKVDAFQVAAKCSNVARFDGSCITVIGQTKPSDTSVAQIILREKGVITSLSAKRFRSFSSSPIWYQQGMENGPPQIPLGKNGEASREC